MAWPTRMGLVTLHFLLRKIVKLAAKFRPVWILYLTEAQIALLDALIEACTDVLDDVPQYEPVS